MKKLKRLILPVCMAGLCFLILLYKKPEDMSQTECTDNIFKYAVKMEHSLFSPGRAEFLTSMEDVLLKTGLTEDCIEGDYGNGKRIVNHIRIEGLSDDILEIYGFEEDRLLTVSYYIPVSDSDYAEVCSMLQEQAYAYIPSDLLLTQKEAVLGKNTGIIWEDAEGNMVFLDSPTASKESENQWIMLSICVTKYEDGKKGKR